MVIIDLTDKVAIVTGASRGIGRVTSKRLAEAGANVVLIARTPAGIEELAREINERKRELGNGVFTSGRALAVTTDVSDPIGVREMVNRVMDEFGHVDILVNNAAINAPARVIETNVETWDKVMAINLKGPYLCCRAVVPHMIGQHYGKIINISSSAAYHFFPGFGAYSSSKAGLLAFTKVLSEEVKEYDVNVNALCLGLINTDRTRKRITGKEIGADPKEWLQPEDVADVVLYFASDLARSVHGAALDVFGKRR